MDNRSNVGTIHDLTERKQWESALIERERELQLITQVGDVLATTLEFEETLTNIAQLVVDNLTTASLGGRECSLAIRQRHGCVMR